MKLLLLTPALAALALAGCGGPTEEVPSNSATEVPEVDDRLPDVSAAATLDETIAACSEAESYGDSEYDIACRDKLIELITVEKIGNDFDAGFAYFQSQLDDGSIRSPVANAANAALTNWLRENARSADRRALFRWRDDLLPAPEDDPRFMYQGMRNILNDAIRS